RRAVEGGVRRHGEGAPGRIGLGPRELLISRSAPRESMGGRFFFFKQKTAYEIGLGIPAEPLFRSIEALKPAIEACGFSSLSQSPMLGFQELDAVIHLLMEAKHWGLRKSRNATSLNSRFKSLDTLKVKIISVTF